MVLVLNEVRAGGVDLVSATETVDTTTSIGRLRLGIITVIGEYERETSRQRIVDGQWKARAQGLPDKNIFNKSATSPLRLHVPYVSKRPNGSFGGGREIRRIATFPWPETVPGYGHAKR